MAQQIKYGFTEEFQTQIAALILRDSVFIREYEDVVDPTYFDYEDLTSIVRLGKNYFEKYGEIPTRASLIQEFEDFCKTHRIPVEDQDSLRSCLSQVYKVSLLNSESVASRVCIFGRRQAVRQGVMKIVDLVDRGSEASLDTASDIMESALRVGYNVNDLGLNFFPNMTKIGRLASREDRGFIHKVRTHIPRFDEKTLGGPGKGEVWVVIGLSGWGKSQVLVNLGKAAIDQGEPVAHLTIGDLDEEDVGVRYGGCLTQCTVKQVLSDDPAYMRRAAQISKYKGKYLRIKYYDPGTVTISHIKAWLSKLVTIDGINPGMLIVDYPDEFKKRRSDNDYQEMGEIYSGLKMLAKQYKMVIWCASQVHRWIPKKTYDVLTMGNIADSAKKFHKADGICSINQTSEENDLGYARLWVDKVRRGQKQFLVPLKVDWSRSIMKEGTLLEDDRSKEGSR